MLSAPMSFITRKEVYELLLHGSGLPGGLVVRIRCSHRRGPGSIPGQGKILLLPLKAFPSHWSGLLKMKLLF